MFRLQVDIIRQLFQYLDMTRSLLKFLYKLMDLA
jgi:hypothetical protein